MNNGQTESSTAVKSLDSRSVLCVGKQEYWYATNIGMQRILVYR
jgi:hypothetical protein